MLPVSVIVGLALGMFVALINGAISVSAENLPSTILNGFTFGTILTILLMNSPKQYLSK